jgi:hypothetical protein
MARLIIRNEEDLTAALKRAEDLMGCTDDSDEERELEEIADAVDLYHDAITVMKAVGRKADAQPEDSVDGSTSGAE